MNKITSIINLFRVGYSVKNPAAWKKYAVDANLFAIFTAIITVLTAYGVQFPAITPEQVHAVSSGIVAIAGGVMAIYNVIIHVITTDKIGIIPKDEPPTQGNATPPATKELSATEQAQNIFK